MIVEEVPATKRDGLILECKKALKPNDTEVSRYDPNYYVGYGYKTPYRGTIVPSDGWLLPEIKTWDLGRYEFIKDERINGRLVHAVSGGQTYSTYTCYKAFAFGVKAYGEETKNGHQVLVCEALYIPCCDKSKKRRMETIATIRELANRPNLVARSVLAKFPLLKGKVYVD